MNLFQRFRSLFFRLTGQGLWLAEPVDDLPERLHSRRVYFVGEPGHPWAAALACPCGCGEVVQLSLVPRDDPSWIASIGRGKRVSLHPSIWRIRGCRSHFFIKEGRTIWAKTNRPDARGERRARAIA